MNANVFVDPFEEATATVENERKAIQDKKTNGKFFFQRI